MAASPIPRSKPKPSRFYFLFDPDVAPLRDRVDFQELVRKIGFVESVSVAPAAQ